MLVYIVAGCTAGAGGGALLGWLGAMLINGAPPTWPVVGLGVSAVTLGGAVLMGNGIRILQRDCETPKEWTSRPFRWALANGATLGAGFRSRLGFWLWYAIPIGAFVSRSQVAGAIIYGTYALVRTGSLSVLFRVARTHPELWDRGVLLALKKPLARLVTSAYLVFLGAFILMTAWTTL